MAEQRRSPGFECRGLRQRDRAAGRTLGEIGSAQDESQTLVGIHRGTVYRRGSGAV